MEEKNNRFMGNHLQCSSDDLHTDEEGQVMNAPRLGQTGDHGEESGQKHAYGEEVAEIEFFRHRADEKHGDGVGHEIGEIHGAVEFLVLGPLKRLPAAPGVLSRQRRVLRHRHVMFLRVQRAVVAVQHIFRHTQGLAGDVVENVEEICDA